MKEATISILKKCLLLTSLAITSVLVCGLSGVNAVDANTSGQALEIAPPVITLSANPGQTIRTKINIRDVSTTDLIIKSQVNDFVANEDESGNPKILLEEGEVSPYSMKDWFDPLPELILKPKKTKDLEISINVPRDAAPGGYYAVVRFTGTPPELEGTGLSLSASLGSLILLRVSGDIKEKMSIEEFYAMENEKTGWLFESVPIQFITRLKNSGNIHEQPFGQITVTDMFGNKLANVNVNMPVRNILPDSIRKFENPLDSAVIGDKFLFGKYTAELTVTYGENKETLTKSIEFWVIPYRLIIIVVIILIAAFFLLRNMIKRYNRHIIKKAQKRK